MRRFLLLAFLILAFAGRIHAQCVVENFIDFEGGTNGVAPTSTTLNSSDHGYSGGNLFLNGAGSIFSTSANQPLSLPTGTLCGNSTNYAAGQGSLGVIFTGGAVTSAGQAYVFNLPSQLQLTTL